MPGRTDLCPNSQVSSITLNYSGYRSCHPLRDHSAVLVFCFPRSLHPHFPPSSSPTGFKWLPPPFLFRLIFQSTTNPLLMTEVMEVVLSLLALLLSFLGQYSKLQRPDLFRRVGKPFTALVSFLRFCPCCHFSVPCFILLFFLPAPDGIFVAFVRTFHPPSSLGFYSALKYPLCLSPLLLPSLLDKCFAQ